MIVKSANWFLLWYFRCLVILLGIWRSVNNILKQFWEEECIIFLSVGVYLFIALLEWFENRKQFSKVYRSMGKSQKFWSSFIFDFIGKNVYINFHISTRYDSYLFISIVRNFSSPNIWTKISRKSHSVNFTVLQIVRKTFSQ